MKRQNKILSMIVGVELILSSFYFIYGTKGIKEIRALQQENEAIQAHILNLTHDNTQLEMQIKNWQQIDWYKEQVAREELQFARSDEQIFLY